MNDAARRRAAVAGVGPPGGAAIVAAVGDGRRFGKARGLAAWIGLVPRQRSTGGKSTLLGIGERGNPHIRRLLIHGARSCVMPLDRRRDRPGARLDGLRARMHPNKAVVASAAKMARVARVVLNRPGALRRRRGPAFA